MQFRTVMTLIGLALGSTGLAAAQLPMVGGSYGQTMRLVVSAWGDPHVTGDAGTGCAALARIASRDLLPASEKSLRLIRGASGFVDVNLNPLAGRPGRRVELLPVVQVQDGACSVAVEVYENFTGRTVAYMPLGVFRPEPAVRRTGALTPAGGTAGQILRLAVVRDFDPQPDPPKCAAVLGFADENGNAVGPTKAVNLAAGGSDFVDLDFGLLLPAVSTAFRTHRFVRPRLLLPAAGGGETGGCAASVQIFERLSGWTTVAYAGQ